MKSCFSQTGWNYLMVSSPSLVGKKKDAESTPPDSSRLLPSLRETAVLDILALIPTGGSSPGNQPGETRQPRPWASAHSHTTTRRQVVIRPYRRLHPPNLPLRRAAAPSPGNTSQTRDGFPAPGAQFLQRTPALYAVVSGVDQVPPAAGTGIMPDPELPQPLRRKKVALDGHRSPHRPHHSRYRYEQRRVLG